jgi:hypothetical protein
MDQLFSSCEQRIARLPFDKLEVQRTLLETVLREKLAISDSDPADQ